MLYHVDAQKLRPYAHIHMCTRILFLKIIFVPTGEQTTLQHIRQARTGAALSGGSGVRNRPPATAMMTCEIRLNPRTFFVVRGISDNAVQNVYTAVCRTFVTFSSLMPNVR